MTVYVCCSCLRVYSQEEFIGNNAWCPKCGNKDDFEEEECEGDD